MIVQREPWSLGGTLRRLELAEPNGGIPPSNPHALLRQSLTDSVCLTLHTCRRSSCLLNKEGQ